MNTNEAGKALILSYEALRLKAYLPTPHDVPTIGWGHTGPDVKMGMAITREEADRLFAKDLAAVEAGVGRSLGGAATTENQFAAMVSLAYNIGLGAFKASTVLREHRAGDPVKAAAAFGLWNKQRQDGKLVVLKGLTRRRKAEADLYLTA